MSIATHPARQPYRQGARANATTALRGRILDVLFRLLAAKDYDRVTLDEIAEGAATTRQTVLRFFGSKDGALTALLYRAEDSKKGSELQSNHGNLEKIAKEVIDHYEDVGNFVVQLLHQEDKIPAIAQRFSEARKEHMAMLLERLHPLLARMSTPEAEIAVLQVRAVTDTLFWRVMRREMALDRADSETLLVDLLRKIFQPVSDLSRLGGPG